MPVNNTHNVAALYADNQQQQQRKANAAQAKQPNAGQPRAKANAAPAGGATVTISAAGRKAAAAPPTNVQAVQQAQKNPNTEAANAIRAYENVNRANRAVNQQPGPTQKTIKQIGGAA